MPRLTVLLVSSTLVDAPLFRITVQPTPGNGLQKPSQIMVNKVMTVKRDKIGGAFGRLDSIHMLEIERCLAVFPRDCKMIVLPGRRVVMVTFPRGDF